MNKNILDNWLTYVSNQDLESVVGLYANDALLLGTFSNQIRTGQSQIREYFVDFLSKKPKANLIESITHHLGDKVLIFNGFYNFEIQNADLVNARFTFVFKQYNDKIMIVSHHSSLIP